MALMRFKTITGKTIFVNPDQVAWLSEHSKGTIIHFSIPKSDGTHVTQTVEGAIETIILRFED